MAEPDAGSRLLPQGSGEQTSCPAGLTSIGIYALRLAGPQLAPPLSSGLIGAVTECSVQLAAMQVCLRPRKCKIRELCLEVRRPALAPHVAQKTASTAAAVIRSIVGGGSASVDLASCRQRRCDHAVHAPALGLRLIRVLCLDRT